MRLSISKGAFPLAPFKMGKALSWSSISSPSFFVAVAIRMTISLKVSMKAPPKPAIKLGIA
jgi:hypothetical protein